MYICAIFIIKKNMSSCSSSSSSSSFSFLGIICRECNRQEDQRGATGGPISHSGCEFDTTSNLDAEEPMFAFPPSCPGCRQFHDEKVARNIAKLFGEPAPDPGAPCAHTCEKFRND